MKNIRVVDLTMHLSGPYCCWLMASLGADVIKVERPEGDPTRETGPFVSGESTYFGSVNRNKRSIVIDLKSVDGKENLATLLRTADVLVENFRPGVLARLGFDADRLKEINPNLVWASISGFGQSGLMMKRPAFDIVLQGMSGMMSVTGSRDGQATAVGISIADVSTGVFAAVSIQAALLERERTGTVRRVEISMLGCQLALLENAAGRYLNAGELATRSGSRHPKITPFQAYEASDRMVVVAADGERNWSQLCKALRLDALALDPRFCDNAARVENYDELEKILAEVFCQHTAAEIEELLSGYDIPCGQVNDISEVLALPIIAEQQLLSEVKRADGEVFRYIASPVAPKGSKEKAAPALGEHTAEILAELVALRSALAPSD